MRFGSNFAHNYSGAQYRLHTRLVTYLFRRFVPDEIKSSNSQPCDDAVSLTDIKNFINGSHCCLARHEHSDPVTYFHRLKQVESNK